MTERPTSARTILIVEDDVDTRDSLRDAFEDEGYQVRCAGNGREGLDALRAFEPPCVVVLDLIMPLMSGNELYAAMKEDPRLARVPVVVSTSDPSRAPNGVLVIKKPVDLGVLFAAIVEACGAPPLTKPLPRGGGGIGGGGRPAPEQSF